MSDVATQHMDQTKQFLVSNAAAQRRFEAMAVENMVVVQNEISSEVASELLKLHWCWIHPMFMFVYRPAFTRKFILFPPSDSWLIPRRRHGVEQPRPLRANLLLRNSPKGHFCTQCEVFGQERARWRSSK